MEYTLLKEVISLLEDFQAATGSDKLEEFILWTNNRLFSEEVKGEGHEVLSIAFRIMHLNKELKKQTKTVIAESLLSSVDEYSFLLHLKHQHSFRKMEIIEIHNLEAPTGIEIIKRLLKNELIEEFPDEDDKRAKRIQITPKGMRELEGVEPKITKVFTEFTSNLDLNEKVKIAGILNKLTT
jgi:DNA-binding MarR family transcriptional regulator